MAMLIWSCNPSIDVLKLEVVSEENELRKTISFETSMPTDAYVEYWISGTDEMFYSKVSSQSQKHQLKIINLLAEKNYDFRIILRNEEGVASSEVMVFETNPLPDFVPDYQLQQADYTFDGYILMKKYQENGCFVLLNDSAQVVWYEPYDTIVMRPFYWSHDQHIVTLQDSTSILEFDLYGTVHNTLDILEKGIDKRIHHELFKNTSDEYVFLNYDQLSADLSSMGGKKVDVITTDGIMIVDQQGNLKWEWSVFDVADPLSDPDIMKSKKDWGHANSISYGEDGNLVVSFRDFHQTWKINSENGAILWKLGQGGDLKVDSTYYTQLQHDAHYIGPNELLIHDNGNKKRGYTRILSFNIDEENRSASVEKNFSLDKSLSVYRMGSAYHTDSTHIMVCSAYETLNLGIYDLSGNQTWDATGKYLSYRAYYIPKQEVAPPKPDF